MVARSVTVPFSRDRPNQWKKNTDRTAAIGIPKIAPAMPAILPPMTTEARTTIGWMPTAPDIIRGEMTFIVTNHAMPITISTGRTALGSNRSATATGGIQDTNGPKNGIAWSRPAATVVSAAYSSPNTMLTIAVNTPNTTPMTSWPRRNPPNDFETLVWSRRASVTKPGGTSRYRKATIAAAVDRDVDRQDHEQQHVAEHADARERERLQRPDELRAPTSGGSPR